jgi:hypothetical protein
VPYSSTGVDEECSTPASDGVPNTCTRSEASTKHRLGKCSIDRVNRRRCFAKFDEIKACVAGELSYDPAAPSEAEETAVDEAATDACELWDGEAEMADPRFWPREPAAASKK